MKRIIATLSLVAVTATAITVAAPQEAHAGKTGTAVAAGIAAGLFTNMLANNWNQPRHTTVIRERVVQPTTVYYEDRPVVIRRTRVIRQASCTNVVDRFGNLIRQECY